MSPSSSFTPSSAIPRLKDVRHEGKATTHFRALRPIVPRCLPPSYSTTRFRAPLAQPALHFLRVSQGVCEEARQTVFLAVRATAVPCATRSAVRTATPICRFKALRSTRASRSAPRCTPSSSAGSKRSPGLSSRAAQGSQRKVVFHPENTGAEKWIVPGAFESLMW